MPETMGLTKYMSNMENMYARWKITAIARNRNRAKEAMMFVCAVRLDPRRQLRVRVRGAGAMAGIRTQIWSLIKQAKRSNSRESWRDSCQINKIQVDTMAPERKKHHPSRCRDSQDSRWPSSKVPAPCGACGPAIGGKSSRFPFQFLAQGPGAASHQDPHLLRQGLLLLRT
jgi:hypothetical protein